MLQSDFERVGEVQRLAAGRLAICSRQLNPSDTISVSRAALRTAGSSTRSPMAWDTSYFPASKPNEPAIPQQPASSDCTSAPVFRSTDSSAPIFITAL